MMRLPETYGNKVVMLIARHSNGVDLFVGWRDEKQSKGKIIRREKINSNRPTPAETARCAAKGEHGLRFPTSRFHFRSHEPFHPSQNLIFRHAGGIEYQRVRSRDQRRRCPRAVAP